MNAQMMALQKVPVALQAEIAGAALRIQNNAAAIYDLLDQKAGPVKVEEVQRQLGIGPGEYRSAMQLLSGTKAEIYVTQDGICLKKFVSTEDQRLWHLSWSLGLVQSAGEQLVLDEDLLKKVPSALMTLLAEGKLREHGRLMALRTKTQKVLGTLLKVANMYRQVGAAIEIALLPKVSEKDWKKQLAEIRKFLPPGH